MPQAINALTLIHKYLRLELFDLGRRLSGAAPADCAAVQLALTEVTALLRRHGEQEDRLLEPKLRLINPALANHMADDHQQLDRQLKRILVLADDLEPGHAEPCARGLAALHRDWMQFVGHYLLHLDDEERLLFPALGETLAPAEALAEAALAQAPAARAQFLQKLQAALTPAEYRMVVAPVPA